MSAAIATATPTFSWPYLELDSCDRVCIAGSRIRLSLLIQAREAHGWSPEELHFQYPTLSLAQIHAALSYYYTQPERIEQEIAAENQSTRTLKARLTASGACCDGEAFTARLLARTQAEDTNL